ncbi:putative cytosolic iron-sulfur protein assembly protein 1 [Ceratocystis lukuohia]|uniref:Probable cytosolic iron-sulfur protein assembly protein 1 n=1 Tax=Ceratocystis lukuohia TaxID=2019550 RepID=A0ABR4MD46_9PEZI
MAATAAPPVPSPPAQHKPLSTRKTEISPLTPFSPDLYERAWCSIPHPTLPLLATAHAKSVTIFSLSTLTKHSALSGGHSRSIRSLSWKPNLASDGMCLATGSFDSTAGLWRWENIEEDEDAALEREVTRSNVATKLGSAEDTDSKEWEFTLVLEGHDSEIKSVQFSPSGTYLATCSRDKTLWIWEDIGASEGDDEWETVAVLNEHEGDVKAVAWCPDVPGRSARNTYASDVLASASYDNTVRIWREDGDGEWVCVSVLEGHSETVWGMEWEGRPRDGDPFPRLLTFSADRTARIWELQEDGEDNETKDKSGSESGFGGALGSIPNTMRRALHETWNCVAILPSIHTREIYAASWSALSGRIATTGGDGRVVVYAEEEIASPAPSVPETEGTSENPGSGNWKVVASYEQAHGAYEVNHLTWCRRFDKEAEALAGVQEMLVTTGDDGVVRSWAVSLKDV